MKKGKLVRVNDLLHKELKNPRFRALFLKELKKLEAEEKAFRKRKNKQNKRGK